jgi:hypothetical protein
MVTAMCREIIRMILPGGWLIKQRAAMNDGSSLLAGGLSLRGSVLFKADRGGVENVSSLLHYRVGIVITTCPALARKDWLIGSVASVSLEEKEP